jgi:cell division protein FtsN
MKRKAKDSKLNVFLTALLVVFVCLLSFSIGVISGKGWSDRDYKVKHIEQDSHLQMAQEDNAPIGDEMSAKEVELLTQKALREAKAQQPQPIQEIQNPAVVKNEKTKKATKEKPVKESEKPLLNREASLATENTDKTAKKISTKNKVEKGEVERKVSSVMPTPTTPPPASIEYTVQVAAYKTINEAEGHSQKLIDKGFPAFPVKAIINGEDWYRVSIGSFKNRSQAMKYESALKKQALVKSTFVQKISRAQE